MLAFCIVSTIVGVILGLRFKVFVLGPATLLATAAITAIGIASGHDARAIALTVFGTTASLQIGYFAGCILHAMVLAHNTLSPPQVGAGKMLNSCAPSRSRQ